MRYIFVLLICLCAANTYADPGTTWGFWGDSQTDGRAPAESLCSSSPEAIESVWDGTSPTSTYDSGAGGRSLLGTATAYGSYGSKSGLTWVHFQESGDQNETGQTTSAEFVATFEAFVRDIDADSPSAIISCETAFSFGREAEAHRNWDTYNTALLAKVSELAADGIPVIVADVDTKIKALQTALGDNSLVWYQTGDANAYHYTALGNMMVALTVWDALGYDVATLDLTGITDISSEYKTVALGLFDSEGVGGASFSGSMSGALR